MKFLFCGDRHWTDAGWIRMVVGALYGNFGPFTVIEGEAKGADTIARQCAQELGLPVEKYPADWANFGRAAGPVRNEQMLRIGKPDAVFAFHNDLSVSKGTANMVQLAMRAGLPIWTVQMGAESLAVTIMQIRTRIHAST